MIAAPGKQYQLEFELELEPDLNCSQGGGTPNKYAKRKPAVTSNLPAVSPATPLKVPPLTVPALPTAPTEKPAAAAAGGARSQSGFDGKGAASVRPGEEPAAGTSADPNLGVAVDGRTREAAHGTDGTDAAGARVTVTTEDGGGVGAGGRSAAPGTEQGPSPEELVDKFGDAGAESLSEGSEEDDYTDLDDDRCCFYLN